MIKSRGLTLNKNAANQLAGRDSPHEPSPPKFRTKALLNGENDFIQPKGQKPLDIISRIPRLSLKQQDAKPARTAPPLARVEEVEKTENVVRVDKIENVVRVDKIENVLKVEKIGKVEKVVGKVVEIEVEDIDKSSREAIYLACDIAKDIYEYMYELEAEQSVQRDYLRDQKILTPRVRQRLINWCIEIHSQLKLLPETLYMTIAVIDRYFDKVPVKQQSQVQLVAVGATLIASKYEEIYPPDVGDLMHLTQNSYSRREIMRIEISILEELNFNLGRPIPLAFLRRFSRAASCDLKMHSIAKYLMELSLTEYECAHWRPSMLAAAALFATIHLVHRDNNTSSANQPLYISAIRKTLGGNQQQQQQQDRWNKTLVHYTHYTREQLQEPAGILCKILKRAQKSPQSYACVKKNLQNLGKWPELKSTRVDELIKLADQN